MMIDLRRRVSLPIHPCNGIHIPFHVTCVWRHRLVHRGSLCDFATASVLAMFGKGQRQEHHAIVNVRTRGVFINCPYGVVDVRPSNSNFIFRQGMSTH